MKHTSHAMIAIAGALAFSSATSAAVITIDPVGRGWVADDGETNQLTPTNNYIAGDNESKITFRNVLAFDFSSVGPSVIITAAQLKLATGPATSFSSTSTTGSPANSETYTLFDVSTDLATIAAGATPATTYADLGTGTTYGARTYTSADTNTTQVITLNAAFLSYANAHLGGTVLLGGAITTLDTDANTHEYIFGNTQDTPAGNTELLVTTAAAPEPCALVLAAAGMLLITRRTRH